MTTRMFRSCGVLALLCSLATAILGGGSAGASGSGNYLLVGADGGVFAVGSAHYEGALPGAGVHVGDIVGIAATPTGDGYWLVGADGGVFAFGSAHYEGSLPADGVHLDDIVGMAAAGTGGGYWLVGADGGVFAFGTARYAGSLPADGVRPAAAVAGIVPLATGEGYYLFGSDGGVFAFGAAVFHGSRRSWNDGATVVGLTLGSDGYGELTTDGQFFSTTTTPPQPNQYLSLTPWATPVDGQVVAWSDGYVTDLGEVFTRSASGQIVRVGGVTDVGLVAPIVGIAAVVG